MNAAGLIKVICILTWHVDDVRLYKNVLILLIRQTVIIFDKILVTDKTPKEIIKSKQHF